MIVSIDSKMSQLVNFLKRTNKNFKNNFMDISFLRQVVPNAQSLYFRRNNVKESPSLGFIFRTNFTIDLQSLALVCVL